MKDINKKIKRNKIRTKFYIEALPSIVINFNYLLILLFLTLFFFSKELNEITLTINGIGKQKIISDYFSQAPSEIVPDGICIEKRECTFNRDVNKITLKFDKPIESCLNMFNGLTGITEIDLSNFDTSHVKDMTLMFNDCI